MTLGELVDKIHAYQPDADAKIIEQAYAFSERVHQGQMRLSGDPYFVHPVGVASIIADMKLDAPSVITGLLHDTVEDTLTTLENVEKDFGAEVASLNRFSAARGSKRCRCARLAWPGSDFRPLWRRRMGPAPNRISRRCASQSCRPQRR